MTSKNIQDVASALRDIIVSQQASGSEHEPTATEYFAILVVTISSATETEYVIQLLTMLEAIIPQSSPVIVRSQFNTLSTSLLKIASVANAESNHLNDKILKLCLASVGNLLLMQDLTDGFWGSVTALQAINALLAFLDDSRGKVRKLVVEKIISLLQLHKKATVKTVRVYIGDFCLGVLSACTRSDYKRSLYITTFLEQSLSLLSDKSVCKVIHALLKTQECEQPILTAAIFRALDSTFQSLNLSLNSTEMSQILQLILELRPDSKDMEANTYFCTTLASAIVTLHKKSTDSSLVLIEPTILALIDECDSEFTQVHVGVASALRRIINECVDGKFVDSIILELQSNRGSKRSANCELLLRIIQSIESLCQLRYQHTWVYVMSGVKALFEKFQGVKGTLLLHSLLIRLAEITQAIDSGIIQVGVGVYAVLSDTVGYAVQSFGFRDFIQFVPLVIDTTPTYIGVDSSKEWLIPILHNNLKLIRCNLADFCNILIPSIDAACYALESPAEYGINEQKLQLVQTKLVHLWSLFPDFCGQYPLDLPAAFPILVPFLLAHIQRKNCHAEIILSIVAGMTSIYTSAKESSSNSMHIQILSEMASSILPTLLMYLETIDICDAKFQSIVNCLSSVCSLASSQLVSAIAKKLLQMVLSTTTIGNEMVLGDNEENVTLSSWITILQSIIPYLPEPMVILLFRTIRPLLTDDKPSLQKRAYAVLDALLKTHGDVIYRDDVAPRMNILETISQSLLTCHVSARSMRLRCIETIFSTMDSSELEIATASIVAEVLICQKDANKKSRDSALDLLKHMISNLPPMVMFSHFCSALVGETTIMRSSAIIGMCILLYQYREDDEIVNNACELLPTICMLLREESTEMSKAVLSYIRVCASIIPRQYLYNDETYSPLLTEIIEGCTSGLLTMKSKFSSRIRAIMRKLVQRVDVDVLRTLVPEQDLPLLDYIQKQSRRAQRRKQQSKENQVDKIEQMLGSDSDDSDDSDDDTNSRHTARPKATRIGDYMKKEEYPSSLSDLMEDQMPHFMDESTSNSRSNRRKTINETLNATNNFDDDENYRVSFSKDGRLVISERKESMVAAKMGDDDDIDDTMDNKGKKKRMFDDNDPSQRMQAKVVNKPVKKLPGEEYRSKKSGGDVWKRGMLEPHAFIPLDPRMLSKKNFNDAVTHFSGVIKGGKGVKMSSEHVRGPKHVTGGNRKQRESAKAHKFKEQEKLIAAAKTEVIAKSNNNSRRGLDMEYGSSGRKPKYSNSGDSTKRPKIDSSFQLK